MKSMIPIAALILSVGACSNQAKGTLSQPNDESKEKLTALEKRIDDIDGRLGRIEKLLADALKESKRPDPGEVYSVPVNGFPSIGPAHAKVTIVKAYEYACGYCYRVRDTIDQLMAAYGGDIRVVYKPFIVHADAAVVPAMAVCAADKQGKFTQMSDLIWEKAFVNRDLGEDNIHALAKEAGLDMARYESDLQSSACLESLRGSVENLSELGVGGTPTFYINGRVLIGAQPIDAFRQLIDEELAKANKALAQGTRLEDYYRVSVVEAGKKSL